MSCPHRFVYLEGDTMRCSGCHILMVWVGLEILPITEVVSKGANQ